MTSTQPTLLHGATVLPSADLEPARLDVLIADGRIQAVATDLAARHHGPMVDLTGHALMPGFFNAHYHSHDALAKGAFESLPLELWSLVARGIGRGRRADEVRVRTQLAAIECLRNGFTTVQDFVNVRPGDEEMLDAMLGGYDSTGIRVVLALSLRDTSELDGIPWGREMIPAPLQSGLGTAERDPDASLAFVQEQLDRTDGPELVSLALGASAPHRCSPHLLNGIAALARDRSLPVYTHLYETQLQRLFARAGLTDHGGSAVRYLADAGLVGPHVSVAHGIWVVGAEIEELVASDTGVVLNLMSNLRLGSGIAPIAAYRRAGARIALGCDNTSCSDVQSPFQAMKLFALLGGTDPEPGAAPSARDALRAATIAGAATAGMAESLGAIEPGKLADMVAVELRDPAYVPLNDLCRQLVYAETGRGVRHVWVAGRWVIRDGRSTTVDEDELAARVEERMPDVRRELARLAGEAERLRPALERIRKRARSADSEVDRYLAG